MATLSSWQPAKSARQGGMQMFKALQTVWTVQKELIWPTMVSCGSYTPTRHSAQPARQGEPPTRLQQQAAQNALGDSTAHLPEAQAANPAYSVLQPSPVQSCAGNAARATGHPVTGRSVNHAQQDSKATMG